MFFLVGVGANAVADRLAEGAVLPKQRDAQVADRLVQPLGEVVDDEVDGRLAVFACRCADLERMLEAAAGDDLGGAGGLPMEHAVALGGLADGDRQRRGERSGGDLDAVLGDQPLGLADRRVGTRGVALQVLDLAAVDAAALVDHVAGNLHRFPVLDAVFGERAGHGQEHADANRRLLLRGRDVCGRQDRGGTRQARDNAAALAHFNSS